MTSSRALNLYLRGPHFKHQIIRGYERFEILSEGALRTAVALAIQTKLSKIRGTAERYRVTCETRLPGSNVVPDILIWKNDDPRFWVELKDTRTFNRAAAEADWMKLQTFCPKYSSIKAGYFIYVARTSAREFPIRRSRATMRFWAIPLVLQNEMRCDFKAGDAEYRRRAHYRSEQVLTKSASAH